jgi:hypothetical protein
LPFFRVLSFVGYLRTDCDKQFSQGHPLHGHLLKFLFMLLEQCPGKAIQGGKREIKCIEASYVTLGQAFPLPGTLLLFCE